MKKGIIQVMLMSIMFTSCKKPDANGPHSDALLGKWGYIDIFETPSESLYGGLGHMPSMTMTFNKEYEFESSGWGKFINKYTVLTDDKLDHSNTNEFQTEWLTGNDGKEDFLVIKNIKGKNLSIEGENRAKIEQDVAKEIYDRVGSSDTICFKVKDANNLICHYPHEQQEWKMIKK